MFIRILLFNPTWDKQTTGWSFETILQKQIVNLYS